MRRLALFPLALSAVLFSPSAGGAQQYVVGTANFSPAQVSVLTSATLVAVNRTRSSVTVENLGTNQVCFGPNNTVTLANGVCLPGTVGAAITIPTTSAVYGIATGGATTVAVMDLY